MRYTASSEQSVLIGQSVIDVGRQGFNSTLDFAQVKTFRRFIGEKFVSDV